MLQEFANWLIDSEGVIEPLKWVWNDFDKQVQYWRLCLFKCPNVHRLRRQSSISTHPSQIPSSENQPPDQPSCAAQLRLGSLAWSKRMQNHIAPESCYTIALYKQEKINDNVSYNPAVTQWPPPPPNKLSCFHFRPVSTSWKRRDTPLSFDPNLWSSVGSLLQAVYCPLSGQGHEKMCGIRQASSPLWEFNTWLLKAR